MAARGGDGETVAALVEPLLADLAATAEDLQRCC